MNDEIISALLDWNPWIEGDIPSALIGIQRQQDLRDLLDIPEIKILEGVRRSGKSTLLYQLVKHASEKGKRALYINFEDGLLNKYPLSEVYYTFLEKHSVDYLLIDEVQNCPDWVPFVRQLYDRKALDQIWITGSNSSLIKKEYAELLTGRNIKRIVSPLSFFEYCEFKEMPNIHLPASNQKEAKIKQLFQAFMTLGAFPAIALRPVLQRELLMNYFDDFIYKDIATRYDVNVSKLRDLAIYLATNSTKLYSYRKMASLMNIHANTVADYISHMKEVFLFDEIYKFDYALKNQLSHDKKLYMVDTGLANSVSFRFSEDKGRMLETIVYQALKRQRVAIYFHRNKNECDFLLKSGTEMIAAIQVTCSVSDPVTRKREIAGLLDALKTYQLNSGLILTLDEEEQLSLLEDDVPYQITIKPVWRWLLETGL